MLILIIYFTFHWKLVFHIFVSGEDDNYFIRIVLVEKHHLNLPSSPCNPDPNYNFRACVYEKVLIHVFDVYLYLHMYLCWSPILLAASRSGVLVLKEVKLSTAPHFISSGDFLTVKKIYCDGKTAIKFEIELD